MEVSSTQDFTTTKDRKMKKMESNGDLISGSPDEILHHILSFLDMQYVVKTSFLSKRWRNLWKSLPVINFREEIFIPPEEGDGANPVYRNFEDFVTRVLSLHNGTGIHTFSLFLEDFHLSSDIATWILAVVSRNIKMLEIRMSYPDPELPSCLFTCKSLTMLKLGMNGLTHSLSLKFPDSTCLPNLKTLHLITICFENGGDVEKFISRCPELETLIMADCMLLKHNDITLLTISAPHLKNFELDYLYLGDPYYPPYPVLSKVKVCAPNLTRLRYIDFTVNVNFLENIPYLVKAEIHKRYYDHWPEILEEEIENVIQSFRHFYNIRSLTMEVSLIEKDLMEYISLLIGFVKLVCSARVGSESWLTPFYNLTFLNLETTLTRWQISAITYLLDNCPNVETLVLEILEFAASLNSSQSILRPVKEDSTNDMECCEAKLPSQCTLEHLKFVEVRNLRGCENELEFLQILLNNAIVLKKMSLFPYDNQSPSSLSRFRGFSERLLAFPRASSIGIIVC